MKSALLYCAAVLAMSGCAVVDGVREDFQRRTANAPTLLRPYTEPLATEPHARVRVSTRGVVRFFPGKACADLNDPKAGGVASTDFWAGTLRHHLNDQTLGMSGVAPPGFQSAEVRVAAHEPVTAVYEETRRVDDVSAVGCHVARAFVLPAGMQAQLTTRLIYGKPSQCELRLIDLTTGQERPSLPAPSQCAPASPSR